VIGLDHLNAYYDVTLKQARLARLTDKPQFTFHKLDIADRDGVLALAEKTSRHQRRSAFWRHRRVRHSLSIPSPISNPNVMGQVCCWSWGGG